MNAARGRVDETRQRFDEVDRKSDAIREQIDKLNGGDAKGSRFLALKVFVPAAVLLIAVVTLGAWWLMAKWCAATIRWCGAAPTSATPKGGWWPRHTALSATCPGPMPWRPRRAHEPNAHT